MRLATASLAISFGLAGCISAQQAETKRIDELRTRAAFDLSCAAAQLKVTCLKEDSGPWGGSRCVTAGVFGCDQKATYVRVQVEQNR